MTVGKVNLPFPFACAKIKDLSGPELRWE